MIRIYGNDHFQQTPIIRMSLVVFEVPQRPAHDKGDVELVEGVEEEAGEGVRIVNDVGAFQTEVEQRDPHGQEQGVLPLVNGPVIPAHKHTAS
jgi:hypothetical protein